MMSVGPTPGADIGPPRPRLAGRNSKLFPLCCKKKAAGFLGGWEAGEGIRRPVTLMDEGYGSDDADGDGGDSGRKMRGGGGGTTTAETPQERWMRERDDWLFGRCFRVAWNVISCMCRC